MNTSRRISFASRVSALFGSLALIAACATRIPPIDDSPPEIRLTITGPGVGREEMSNPPRESWAAPDGSQMFELEQNAEYGFVLLVGDQGGVQRAHLRLPAEFTLSDIEPPEVDTSTGPLEHALTVTGSRSDPRTALSIAGRFRTRSTPGTSLSFEFHVEADDFGGSRGRPNQRFMSVHASVAP
jgi:hypothetical protein